MGIGFEGFVADEEDGGGVAGGRLDVGEIFLGGFYVLVLGESDVFSEEMVGYLMDF